MNEILEMPNDVQAEYSVLGAMLVDKRALNIVFEFIDPEDFYDDRNKEVYRAMLSLNERNQPIDNITVTSELSSRNSIGLVGGPVFIAELSTKVSITSNVKYYADIVKDLSKYRALIKLSNEIKDKAYRAEESTTSILDFAENRLIEVSEGNNAGLVRLNETMSDVFQIINERSKNKGKLTGITTGYEDLNFYLKGLHKQDLIIIAARPSMGKTAFAMNIAVNAAIYGKAKVAVFSLEMGREQLAQRMLGATGLIELEKIATGNLTDSDWAALIDTSAELNKANIFIDDTPGITLTELKAKCKRLKVEEGLDLIVIDYLQLMQGEGRTENRQQEISKISRGLKGFAKEMNCPLIALSQLSRAPDARSDRRPVISDLRESGAIEQDADVVMLIYRDDYYNDESEEKGIAEIIIAKHRNGPVGTIKLIYRPEFTRFISFTRATSEGNV
ncbi:MAG: replicative DNA helicase [Tissierellia bacterium]|nr:replicative DNA helicase [Tissierellia bacterium]